MLDVKEIYFIDFKGICVNFLLGLNFFISSHPVTSIQPHKIVQIHMSHPVVTQLKKLHHFSHLALETSSQCNCSLKYSAVYMALVLTHFELGLF